jgi:colicin import membrane protein
MTPDPAPGTPDVAPETNPFRYGWRYVPVERPDGKEDLDQVPLTLEDVLHPKEGDVIPENTRHSQERAYVFNCFRRRLLDRPGALVLSDCLVDWGVTGLGNHSPDVSVFLDVADTTRDRGTFYLAKDGGRIVLALEIVSPDTRKNDAEIKLEHYHRAGVPLYVIVDQEREGGPRRLLAYRHRPKGYEPVALDERGRVLIAALRLRLGLIDNKLVCFDADTDAQIGDYPEVSRALEAADRKIEDMAQKMEGEIDSRQAAERKAREAQAARETAEAARQAAERKAREEESARQAAESARQAAEQREREQAAARQAAEQRLRDLEAELARLRGTPPG